MRAILIVLLSGACFLGCKHPGSSEQAVSKPPAPIKRGDKAESKPVSRETPQEQRGTAITESTGKVASVNAGLRFVVIDFGFNPVPQVDQRMSIYRQGQKVGEIKISSQARNNIIAADITAGEASVGDEVRPQ
jgi:hypothetical protein